MNDAIYLRLEELMKRLGFSTAAASYTAAEMKAYAAAISLVDEKMDEIMKNIFITTAENMGISMFLSMIGEKTAANKETSKELIISAVSDPTGIYSTAEFDHTVSTIGTANQSSYTINGNIMNFNYAGNTSRPGLDDYSKLITDYNPCTIVVDNQSGRTFAAWDQAGFRWYEIDSRNIPFATLDTIK